jgi:hypothetical protein
MPALRGSSMPRYHRADALQAIDCKTQVNVGKHRIQPRESTVGVMTRSCRMTGAPERTAMRLPFVALLLASIVATPAFAGSRHPEDAEIARAADKLNDPAMQSAMSGVMVAMADMMMSMRVDKFRDAVAKVDPDARRDRDGDWDNARTLGDVVQRDNPRFRDDLRDNSRMAMGMMGSMATSMAGMMPEFRAMAERMSRDLEKTMRRLPRD